MTLIILGDILGDTITGFFEFDGDINTFTIQGDQLIPMVLIVLTIMLTLQVAPTPLH